MKKIVPWMIGLLLCATIVPVFVMMFDTVLIVSYSYLEPRSTVGSSIPSEDNGDTNDHHALLGISWQIANVRYKINEKTIPRYVTDKEAVVLAIQASFDTWNLQMSKTQFAYDGNTKSRAGRADGVNAISFGSLGGGGKGKGKGPPPRHQGVAIAVTYIWVWRIDPSSIAECDTKFNTEFQWSITVEAGEDNMIIQNIATHEFGHWVGLADLYNDEDYWLTMYGYADYNEVYKITLGLGDKLGAQVLYG